MVSPKPTGPVRPLALLSRRRARRKPRIKPELPLPPPAHLAQAVVGRLTVTAAMLWPGVDLPLCTVDVAEVPRCARLGVGVIGDRLKKTGLHASRCTLAGSRLTPHESGKSLLIAFRSIPARPIRTSLGAGHPGYGLASGLGGPLGVRACEVQREGEQ